MDLFVRLTTCRSHKFKKVPRSGEGSDLSHRLADALDFEASFVHEVGSKIQLSSSFYMNVEMFLRLSLETSYKIQLCIGLVMASAGGLTKPGHKLELLQALCHDLDWFWSFSLLSPIKRSWKEQSFVDVEWPGQSRAEHERHDRHDRHERERRRAERHHSFDRREFDRSRVLKCLKRFPYLLARWLTWYGSLCQGL